MNSELGERTDELNDLLRVAQDELAKLGYGVTASVVLVEREFQPDEVVFFEDERGVSGASFLKFGGCGAIWILEVVTASSIVPALKASRETRILIADALPRLLGAIEAQHEIETARVQTACAAVERFNTKLIARRSAP